MTLSRAVIVGGGFGGLSAASALHNAPVSVTLIDKRNYHLFRPMLYQVATGLLSGDEISSPLRSIFSRQKNVQILFDEVTGINSDERVVHPSAAAQVKRGVEVYKDVIREHILDAVPFYPLGMPDVTNAIKPIALGIKSPRRSFVAVWRIDGDPEVRIRTTANSAILYPSDLGITIRQSGDECIVVFPRPRMGCILSV